MFPTIDPCIIGDFSYPDHGEVCRIPHHCNVNRDEVTFECNVCSVNAVFCKKIYINKNTLCVEYFIENRNSFHLPYIWAGHMMFAGADGAYATDNFQSSTAKGVMIGRNTVKLKAAAALGAETINIREKNPEEEIKSMTNGGGADFVIECSGTAGTFTESVRFAARNGVVGLIGFYEKSENDVNIDTIVSRALTVFGVMGEYGNMSGVLEILEKSKPDMLPIITGELPFDA